MPRKKKEQPNRSDQRYEVKITVGKSMDGKPIRKSFYSAVSKEDAQNKAYEWKVQKSAAELSGRAFVDNSITFERWAEQWLTKYKEPNVKSSTYNESYKRTVDNYLTPYFGKTALADIKPIDITTFFLEQSEKYYYSTLHKMKLCLNGIFETAIENNLCYRNPCRNVSIKSKKESAEKRTYSKEEVEKILKFSDTHKYGIYIRILLELGLRCSELCGLKWGDIDTNAKTVSIKRACTESKGMAVVASPKNKSSERTLPLSTALAERLEAVRGDAEEFILTSRKGKGKPITPCKFSAHKYKTFFTDYGETDYLTPHELRHTCGTLLYEKTKDIYAVSKYLGHANINITSKLYVHDSPDLLRDSLGII